LTCVRCGGEQEISSPISVCENCSGNLQVVYDYKKIRSLISRRDIEKSGDYSMWRYTPLMPFEQEPHKPPVQIGWTPLYRVKKLGRKLGLRKLFLKDDGRNPSASSKDRASGVAIAHALAMVEPAKGEHFLPGDKNRRPERLSSRAASVGGDRLIIAGASTGNAASSLACLAAPLGLKTVIFVPETAPRAKIAQLLVFGATVLAVRGSYDDAFDLCLQASVEYGWYNRNTGYNPFTREGKKTAAYEICEQMSWHCPDWVFVPAGDGNILSGVWKGFIDLHELGFIDKLPKLAACQAEGSDAITRAFESDGVIRPAEGRTVADSIAVKVPRDGEAAVRAIEHSDGTAIAVPDEEIVAAIPELARETGVFAEPAASVSLAALRQALKREIVDEGDSVVLLVTGNGLKDVDTAMGAAGEPLHIDPDMAAVRRIVAESVI
jgi:threonine synthase